MGCPAGYSTSQDVIHRWFPECVKKNKKKKRVGLYPLLQFSEVAGENCPDMKSDVCKDSVMMELQHSLCLTSEIIVIWFHG